MSLVLRCLLGLLWLLLAICPAVAAPDEPLVPEREVVQRAPLPAWKELWDEGRQAVRRRQPAAAVAHYQELLAQRPRLHEARWELARILLHLEQPRQALEHFELLREARPRQWRYNLGLAETLLTLERFARAAELYDELLRQRPDEPRLLAGRAKALLGRQEPAAALPYLARLARLAPDYPGLGLAPATGANARESLARLYVQLGKLEPARPLLRELAAPPQAPTALLQLAAEVHEALGRRRRAVAYWRRILARDDDHRQAAAALEAYMVEEGKGEEALSYLLPRLAADPDNPRLLKRVVEVYLELERYPAARLYLEHYLALEPADRPALERLLALYRQLGLKAETLLVQQRLLALDGRPTLEKLLAAARLFAERGDYRQALALYPRILQQRPDDPRIIARQLWLLERLGRDDEIRARLEERRQRRQAREILAAWRQLAPDNRRVTVALALVELERGATTAAAELLTSLDEEAFSEPEALRARAWLHEQRRRPHAAWRDYETLLQLAPHRHQERRRALELAADLGMPAVVAQHRRQLLAGEEVDFELALTLAAALRRAHDLDGAYKALEELASLATTSAARVEWRLERSRLFEVAGLAAAAEEELRLALLVDARRPAVLLALTELALARQRPAAAASWLTALERWQRFNPRRETVIDGRRRSPAQIKALVELGRLRQELASGESRAARRRLRWLLAQEQLTVEEFVLPAAAALLAAQEPQTAIDLLMAGWQDPAALQPESPVLAARAAEQQGRFERQREFLGQARQWAAVDAGRGLELLSLLARHGQTAAAKTTSAAMAEALPASLTPPLRLAAALESAGETGEALRVLQELAFGRDMLAVLQRRSRLLLARGQLERMLALVDRQTTRYPWSKPALLLPRVHALWLQRRWDEALAELAKSCEPGVEARFAAAAAEAGIPVPVAEPPVLWGRLTGEVDPRRALLDEVMAPAYAAALEPGDERLRRLAAPLYADYRRQQRLELELRARRAVQQREFFAARRDFAKLVGEYPDEYPLLYDLAGLYGRFQRLEPEAAVYRQLAAAGIAYPGLEEAMRRNQGRRRPRTTVGYGYRREEGRDGRKAIVDQHLRAAQHWVPRLGHELDFVAGRRFFGDPDGDASLTAREFELGYRRDALAGLEIFMALGARSLLSGEQDLLLGEAGIAGDLGDRARGEVVYRRTAVDDTLEAISSGIVADSLNVAGGVDLLPRLEVGAGYGFRYFSDYNQTHGYDFRLAYKILTDPTLLTVGYRYDFRDSHYAGRQQDQARASRPAEDAPYWAPVDYWRKTFEVSFRHRLTDDPYGREPANYYTLRYATIYDSDGRPHQLLAGGVFWEWNKRWTLQAEIELSDSAEYRRRDFGIELSYRW
ncbi:MAG: tetratricopeptide repeat protein [Desulfurivibrio sp.]|nr:tetratricopeptide repeat protein [Desulfurivibrio sp.]